MDKILTVIGIILVWCNLLHFYIDVWRLIFMGELFKPNYGRMRQVLNW